MARPVFVLRVRAEPGVDDAIRNLGGWLKSGLRNFGLRCLDIHQEQNGRNDMTVNLNNIETQRDRTPLPNGVYCFQARVIPGGVGDDGMLRRAKNGRQLMLELECKVIGGEHEGRKLWDYITVDVDESTNGGLPPIDAKQREKLQVSLRLGLVRLRAIIDSAFRLDPNDRSAEAEKKRSFDSYDFFDGVQFYAQVSSRPASGKYGPSNQIDFIVVLGDPAYPDESKAVVPRQKWSDLDDELPY